MNILVLLQDVQGIGGTNLLLKKYANWMREEKNCNVCESISGIVDTNFKNIEWDLVVLPTSELSTLIKLKIQFIKFNKILVWSLGHNAFTEAFISGKVDNYEKNIFYKIIDQYKNVFLRKLLQKNSIIFTDEVSLNSEIQFDNLNTRNLIFPIIISKENRLLTNDIKLNNQLIRCTWVGRIDKDFKLVSLLKLINDLKYLNKKFNIELNLIGTGDSIDIALNSVKYSNLKYKHFEHIPYEMLHNQISNITDLAFAMGTSSLDTSKIGIPTIVVQPLRENQFIYNLETYRWIFESKGLSLGEFANKKTVPLQIKKTIKGIINDYINDKSLSDKSFDYCENFYIDNVLNKLYKRDMPKKIDIILWIYIFASYLLKEIKIVIKGIRSKL